MSSGKSTRISIVEQSLADILERLTEIPAASPVTVARLRELRTKALGYERTTKAWVANPPTEAQRSAMLKLVLELNVEVMQTTRDAVKESERPPGAPAGSAAKTARAIPKEPGTGKTKRPRQ